MPQPAPVPQAAADPAAPPPPVVAATAPATAPVVAAPVTPARAAAPQAALTSVLDRLRDRPTSFGFFQAVRVLYAAHGFDARGSASRPGPVRFATPASLDFPASELVTLEPDATGSWRMVVAFLGLTGPSGVLPRHYTEHTIARQQARDRATQDFLDLFNHRLLALFWRAWAKYRPDIGREFGFRNGPLRYLHHLVGLGTPALQARLSTPTTSASAARPRLPGAATAYFAGLISQRPHGAAALSQVVGDAVGAPVAVEGCYGTWQALPAAARTRLGRSAAALGDGAVLGSRYWDRQTTLQLRIGPLDRARFRALLPGAALAGSTQPLLGDVVELARFMTGLALDLRIRLVLAATDVPPLALGARGADRPRLGWNTWLSGRRRADPADDCEFHLSATGGQSWR
ncbi:MAG TPA: type VI secretion system baseplate subunit TssG [Luteimonas sp.]|nr:type VI secretion system baseplate subunit TssG [Luteimonas sp.]